MGAETSGFDELVVEISQMVDVLESGFGGEGIKEIMKAGAEPILEQAKINAPVKSGIMKGDLKIKTWGKGQTFKATIGVHRGAKGYYAFFVEKGHKGPRPAPPHPFMEPAFDMKKDEAYGIIRDALKDKLNTFLK